MKTIVAGSRSITNKEVVLRAVKESGFNITEVVSGRALGVDTLGEEIAKDMGLPVKPFPANWGKYGPGAGFLRNSEMADYAEALIAVWDGDSPGTADMISKMGKRKKKIFIHKEKKNE